MAYNDVYVFLQNLVISLWAMWEVRVIVIHTLVNFVVAVALAINQGSFQAAKLYEVFIKKLLPLVMIYTVFRFAGTTLAGAPPEAGFGQFIKLAGSIAPYAVLAAIEVLLISDLVDNLSKIPGLGGLIEMLPTGILKAFLKTS